MGVEQRDRVARQTRVDHDRQLVEPRAALGGDGDELARSEAERRGGRGMETRARLHPATAAALGVAPGETVSVTAPGGATLRDLVVVLDTGLARDAVALLDAHPDAPLNALGAAFAVTVEKALVPA